MRISRLPVSARLDLRMPQVPCKKVSEAPQYTIAYDTCLPRVEHMSLTATFHLLEKSMKRICKTTVLKCWGGVKRALFPAESRHKQGKKLGVTHSHELCLRPSRVPTAEVTTHTRSFHCCTSMPRAHILGMTGRLTGEGPEGLDATGGSAGSLWMRTEAFQVEYFSNSFSSFAAASASSDATSWSGRFIFSLSLRLSLSFYRYWLSTFSCRHCMPFHLKSAVCLWSSLSCGLH